MHNGTETKRPLLNTEIIYLLSLPCNMFFYPCPLNRVQIKTACFLLKLIVQTTLMKLRLAGKCLFRPSLNTFCTNFYFSTINCFTLKIDSLNCLGYIHGMTSSNLCFWSSSRVDGIFAFGVRFWDNLEILHFLPSVLK